MAELCPSPFITPPIFWLPDRLSEPNAWIGHIPFAFWLVDALRPRTLVELGTHSGNSYLAFCQAVERLQLSANCRAIDTWKGDPQAGFYGEEVFLELSGYHDARYGAFSQLIRSTFNEAVDFFENGSIDLLHVDGFHTYEAVKRDFELWLPKLSERSIVLFHDIEVRDRDFGVWKFWQEIRERYPGFSFAHSYGLGVLGIGSDLPNPLQRLFALDKEPSPREQLKTQFARLGDSLIGQLNERRLQEENARLSRQLQQLEQQLYQVHERWQDYRTHSRQMQSELEQSIGLAKQYRTQFHQTYKAWERTQSELQQAQEGWEQAQEIIQWMETSKFWRLREFWMTHKPS